MYSSSDIQCQTGKSRLLRLPAEVLELICERYFENDELVLSSQSVLQSTILSVTSGCSLNIDLVCHQLTNISRRVQDRIWGQHVLIKLPEPIHGKALIEEQQYQWLRDHVQSLTIDISMSALICGASPGFPLPDLSILVKNCPRVHTLHIKFKMSWTTNLSSLLHTFRTLCGDLPPHRAKMRFLHLKSCVTEATSIPSAHCGEAYQVSVTNTSSIMCGQEDLCYYLVRDTMLFGKSRLLID